MVSPERCDRYAHLDTPERPGGSALDDSRSGNRARFTPESLDGSQSGRRARLLRTLELDADLAGLDGSRGSQRSGGSGRDESRRSKSRTPDRDCRGESAAPGFLALVSQFCDELWRVDGARGIVEAFRDGLEARAAAVDVERASRKAHGIGSGPGSGGDALAAATAASTAVLVADHARLARDKVRLEHEVLGLRQALAARDASWSAARPKGSFEQLRNLFDSLRANRYDSPGPSRARFSSQSLSSSPCQAPWRQLLGKGRSPNRPLDACGGPWWTCFGLFGRGANRRTSDDRDALRTDEFFAVKGRHRSPFDYHEA